MNANPPPVELSHGSAVISNGTVTLGVLDLGDLNFNGYGVRYNPTNGEAIDVGCLCEGWGAADATSGVQGWASVAMGTVNVGLVSFSSTASTATSVATVGSTLRVTHVFQPSTATPFLYEINVTIDNISGAPVDLRYTRDMDWDVPPTIFNEFVTIQGTAAEPTVLYADNDGFISPAPLSGRTSLGAVGDFIDFGPLDQGALFDLGLGPLAPGASKSFTIFYGAADSESTALAAIAAVGATVYSLGEPSSLGGPDLGIPNTFIFAYRPRVPLGETAGFWSNRNGNARLDNNPKDGVVDGSVPPDTLGGFPGRTFYVDEITESNKILKNNACTSGSPMIFNCAAPPTGQGLSDRLKVNTLNTLAAQTLTLYYNIRLISGYASQTILTLSTGTNNCTGLVTTPLVGLGLAPASGVTDVLVQANLLIQNSVATSLGGTTTQAQAGAMNSLLSCLNRDTL